MRGKTAASRGLQGPELRTGTISEPVSLKNGDIVEICGIPEKVKDSSVSGADRKEIAQKSENKDIEKIPAEKNICGKGSGTLIGPKINVTM